MGPILPDASIESVVVTFDDTGVAAALQAKPGSASSFFPRFPVGDDDVQLRLDWSDLDQHGQPTLDADFINRKTGKHRSIKGSRKAAHHTAASVASGVRCYEWAFDGVSRRFSVAVTWSVSLAGNVSFSGSLEMKVIRGRWSSFRHYTTWFVIWGALFSFLQPVTVEQMTGTSFWMVKLQQALLGIEFGVVCGSIFTLFQNQINPARRKWLSWVLAIITWIAINAALVLATGRIG